MEHATTFKGAIAGFGAALTVLWGWTGWLVVVWIACMALDYISGSIAAGKNHEWNSEAAHNGLAGKGGMILFVLGATALDILIGLALENMTGFTLPFDYNLPIVCLVLCWYIITEIGSLFENAEKMGAEYPLFLKKIVDAMKSKFGKGGKEDGDI